MRKKEKGNYGKYQVRLAQEVNRHHLEKIFEFLEHGIPSTWKETIPGETGSEVEEVQKAIREVLISTLSATPPSLKALSVIKRCLDLPVQVKAGARKVYRNKEWSERVLFAFETSHYHKQVVERLRTCLSDFYEVTIRSQWVEVWPVGLCKNCDKLFLKKKTDQIYCSRKCMSAYDYTQRKDASNGEYARKKARKSYNSPGAKLKRKKAAEKKSQKIMD